MTNVYEKHNKHKNLTGTSDPDYPNVKNEHRFNLVPAKLAQETSSAGEKNHRL